ncbi:2-(3-amino-3-carboxypropyl)histidine synthase subunit 2, partial [Terrapene carolina triunguis]|uniref:2-(3-amino-3-carboxypropyl)histidine synthase subunit 2 n=1 Tax=Terrapene triunguis TaxID=2587831 RepID=UPI000E773D65
WLGTPVSERRALREEVGAEESSLLRCAARGPPQVAVSPADTLPSSGSCCVDEVAAEHVGAEAVVHYGPACLSPCRKLPVLHVFGRQPLDTERCAGAFRELYPDPQSHVVVLSDVVYAHALGELEQLLGPEYPHVVFSRLASDGAPDCLQGPGLVRQFGRLFAVAARRGLQDYAVFYVGAEGLALTNFMLSWNRCPFSSFDPATGCGRHESLDANRALLRRLYLVERARDARVVGILVGTLGVAGYLSVLEHLRDTLRRAGKRSYTLAMGKLSPAKLANFLEVDVFVLVACPQNSLLDSRDFYRPVVTPYELELACNPAREWSSLYVTDFRDLLPEPLPPLLPASFLESRSWRGLEQQLGQTPVTKAVPGRRGIAIAYEDEASG